MDVNDLRNAIKDEYSYAGLLFDEVTPYVGATGQFDLPTTYEVVEVDYGSDGDYGTSGYAVIKVGDQYFKITGDNSTEQWSWGEHFRIDTVEEVEPVTETITTYKPKESYV